MKVYTIPGKLDVAWNDEVKAIIDTWTSYHISLEDFREAVLVKGMDHAKANGAVAWIIDSSTAEGTFSQEIQEYINTDVLPSFGSNGIKYFITISSQVSALTNLTVKTYSAKAGPHGLQVVELGSVADAITWLKANC
jgi:hypothetical protein